MSNEKNHESNENCIELPAESGILDMNEEQLRNALVDSSKLWLAHDGLWFQAVERSHGMDAAIDADREAWRVFTTLEAKRIMSRLGVLPDGSATVDDLALALRHRLYANVNKMRIMKKGNTLIMTMVDCRVQSARKRKNLNPFPCKSVGILEYTEFARTINPKFKTECGYCPPDDIIDKDGYCQWVFTIEE